MKILQTQEKLTQLFRQKGEVTDVKLKYDDQGNFRRFAFVGYKTVEMAQQAQEYFDKTYVGAAKICVELCTGFGKKFIFSSTKRYTASFIMKCIFIYYY